MIQKTSECYIPHAPVFTVPRGSPIGCVPNNPNMSTINHDSKPDIEQYESDVKKEDAYHDPALPSYPGVDAVAQQTLAEGRSPWKVILTNPRLLLLIMAVQSNAIIVGVEFSLPGNLLGIQVSVYCILTESAGHADLTLIETLQSFCKLMGYYSEGSQDYQIEAQHLSM